MNKVITPEIREVLNALHYRPSVSIILPLESKMSLKTELLYSLKTAADKVEKEMQKNYPDEMGMLVMNKLRTIIKNLVIETHKKSIAVYVSPVFEKVLYLDFAVEEKIVVDESFEIRDLLYSNKQLHKYLMLLLSGKESRIYLGSSGDFVRVDSGIPESIYAYENEAPEKVANFSDASDRKEILIEKFLQHIDTSLDTVTHEYQLPIFVLGAEKILGHFKKITKHSGVIIDYIHGNYEERTFDQLNEIMKPHIAEWRKMKQLDLLNLLNDAASKKKLAFGMKEVWSEIINHKGRLLVVEKDFMYAAEHGSNKSVIYELKDPYNKFSYIKDAVDDVMEKILVDGGDVEFVDKDFLKNYDHIALVQYY